MNFNTLFMSLIFKNYFSIDIYFTLQLKIKPV